ncbi:MAG TPA: response regulator, partial [Bacteroidales bacterium]|nr:response regulator [Bacteroidales bacterium]
NVFTANSGYGALEMLENSELPDLLLIDLQMPVIDGFQTIKLVKEKYCDLKIIAQSAHGYEGKPKAFKEAGFDDYITKPYTKDQLLAVVARTLI